MRLAISSLDRDKTQWDWSSTGSKGRPINQACVAPGLSVCRLSGPGGVAVWGDGCLCAETRGQEEEEDEEEEEEEEEEK